MAAATKSKKRGKYGSWTTENLDRAMVTHRNGEAGLNAVSKMYGIPKATLKRHVDSSNKYANGIKYSGHPCVLPAVLEEKLVDYCLRLEDMLIGLSRKDLMAMAFQLAEKNGLPHSFNKEKQTASQHWFKNFMGRHPNLSLRQPEATSLARAKGFNRTSVVQFYEKLENLMDEHQFPPTKIYNVDESGITTVQNPGKVIAKCGKKQVGSLTSGERGINTTVVCCMSASGQFIPPMILFKRQRMVKALALGAPVGSVVTNNETGWMKADTFLEWLRHFQNHVHCSIAEPGLLVLDGHMSHTRNIPAIDYAREHGIHILSLPPHTTHRLQPLDRTYYGPMMQYYNQECDKHIRNEQKPVTVYNVCTLFGRAYTRSASVETGIYPCNRDIWSDEDFAAASRFEDADTPELPNARSSAGTNVSTPSTHHDQLSDSIPVQSINPETARDNVPESDAPSINIPDQSDLQIVPTNPDGRCYFRSVAISLDVALQVPTRDENCEIVDFRKRIDELASADSLRSRMTNHMLENFDLYQHIDEVSANADLPRTRCFASIGDRIASMANPVEMIGELEITATARCLQRPIVVYVGRSQLQFGTEFQSTLPIKIRFEKIGDDVGHYDALVDADCTSNPTAGSSGFIMPDTISPIPKVPVATTNRKPRSSKSEIITSSPYKRQLMESVASKSKSGKPTISRKRAAAKQNGEAKGRLRSKSTKKTTRRKTDTPAINSAMSDVEDDSDGDPWFCPLCLEERRETMVRCVYCTTYVHEACAGGLPQNVQCDLCQ